ncbi:MAG: lysylphosphatidylglycerol synthase transmembrane domain-containing protein, partial [Bdellovibrionota bacterium]
TKVVSSIKLALKFGFAFAILGYMVYSGRLDMNVVRRGFSHSAMLLASCTLVFFALVTSLYRWGLLLRGQGIEITMGQLIRYGMIGNFFNTTMPGAVSGDLIKAWYLLADYKGQKKTPLLTSILLDRVMGVFGLVIVSASPIFFQWRRVWDTPQLAHLAQVVLLLFASVVFFYGYLLLSASGPLAKLRFHMNALNKFRPGKMLLEAYDALITYREHPVILVQALLLSICTHLFIVTVVIFCAQALGETNIPFFQFFLLVPIGLLSTAVPVAPSGLGVGHVAFDALFRLAGSTLGAEIFTMLVTIQIMWNLTGIIFYLAGPKARPALAVEV